MTRITTFILSICFCNQVVGQQLTQYSLWLTNPYGYNPACAGLEPTLVLNGTYRQQWVDLDGAPTTQQINAHLPLHALSSGVGIRIENDAIGAHRTTQGMLSYNYQMGVGGGLLALGGGVGYQQYVLDGTLIRTPNGDYRDQQFQHNDAYLPLGKISLGTPVFELGLSWSSDQWMIGAAAQPVFAPVIRAQAPGQFNLAPKQHYLVHAKYQRKVNDHFWWSPGMLVKTDGVVWQSEVAAQAVWKDKFLFGGGYRGFTQRSRDAAILFAGLAVNDKTMFTYGYDLPISGLKGTNRGSHELGLRYMLNKPLGEGKLPPIQYNPRYF